MKTDYLDSLSKGINSFLSNGSEWDSSVSAPVSNNIFKESLVQISAIKDVIDFANLVLDKIKLYTNVLNEIGSLEAQLDNLTYSDDATIQEKAQIDFKRLGVLNAIKQNKDKLEKTKSSIENQYDNAMYRVIPATGDATLSDNVNTISVKYYELLNSITAFSKIIGSDKVDTSLLNIACPNEISALGVNLVSLKTKIDDAIKALEEQLRMIANNVTIYANQILENESLQAENINDNVSFIPISADDSTNSEDVVQGNDVYVVRPGDNLSKIAKNIYGDAGRYKDIYEYNKDLIGSNPNLIKVGMVLVLPGFAKAVTEFDEQVENLDENERTSSVESENVDEKIDSPIEPTSVEEEPEGELVETDNTDEKKTNSLDEDDIITIEDIADTVKKDSSDANSNKETITDNSSKDTNGKTTVTLDDVINPDNKDKFTVENLSKPSSGDDVSFNVEIVGDYSIRDNDGQVVARNLSEHAQNIDRYIYNKAKEIGMNDYQARLAVAISRWETGHYTSSKCRNDNNPGGITNGGLANGFKKYDTAEEGISDFLDILQNGYFTDPNRDYSDQESLAKISEKYCGDGSNWEGGVGSIYNSDYVKVGLNI